MNVLTNKKSFPLVQMMSKPVYNHHLVMNITTYRKYYTIITVSRKCSAHNYIIYTYYSTTKSTYLKIMLAYFVNA